MARGGVLWALFFGVMTTGVHHVVASVTQAITFCDSSSLQLVTISKWYGTWGVHAKSFALAARHTELLSLHSSDLAIKYHGIFANYSACFWQWGDGFDIINKWHWRWEDWYSPSPCPGKTCVSHAPLADWRWTLIVGGGSVEAICVIVSRWCCLGSSFLEALRMQMKAEVGMS